MEKLRVCAGHKAPDYAAYAEEKKKAAKPKKAALKKK